MAVDKETLNWFTSCCALYIVTDGLKDYVYESLKTFHQDLYKKLATLPNCTDNCSKTRTDQKQWCHTCCSWLDELQKHFHQGKRCKTIYNLNSSKWPVSIEEITKVYIHNLPVKGNETKLNLDIQNILSLFENCSVFNVPKDLIMKNRNIRNEICHNSDSKVSDTNLEKCFLRIFPLLHHQSVKKTESGKKGFEKLTSLKEKGILDFLQKDKSTESYPHFISLITDFKSENHDIREQLNDLKTDIANLKTPKRQSQSKFSSGKNIFYPSLGIIVAVVAVVWLIIPVNRPKFQVQNTGCVSMVFTDPWVNDINVNVYLDQSLNLTGRDWLVDYVIANLSTSKRGVLLTAGPGYGKSAFISNILCGNESSNGFILRKKIIAFHICKYDVLSTQKPYKFIRSIVGKMSVEIPEFKDEMYNIKKYLEPERCSEDPFGCFDNGLVSPLKKIVRNNTHIIVIDGLDECDKMITSGGISITSILIKRIENFPDWIKFLITSRNVSSITSRFTSLHHISLQPISPEHLQDVQIYIDNRLKDLFGPIRDTQSFLDRHALSLSIIQASSANFLYLTHLLGFNISKIFINDYKIPSSLEELYLQNFERLFSGDEHSFQAAKIIFEIMCASYYPLDELELVNIAVHSSLFTKEMFLKTLGKTLGHVILQHDSKITFVHKAVNEFLIGDKRKYRAFSISLEDGHKYIANYYLNHLNNSDLPNIYLQLNILLYLPLHISVTKDNKMEKEFIDIIKLKNISISLTKDTDTILHHMARQINDYTAMKIWCLASSVDVNAKNMANVSTSFIAAAYGHTESLHALYDLGGDITFKVKHTNISLCCTDMDDVKHIHYYGYNLLHVSSQNGHFQTVQFLINQKKSLMFEKNSFGSTPFHLAVEFGHEDIVKLFLDNGYTSVDQLSLHHAAMNGHLTIVDLLLQKGAVDNCMKCDGTFYWLKENEVRLQSPLSRIVGNKSIFQDDWHMIICETALEAAIKNGHFYVFERLVGENINGLYCTDYGGRSVLMTAIKYNRFDIFTSLLKKGASVSDKCLDQQILNCEKMLNFKEFFYQYIPERCALKTSVAHLIALHNRYEMAKLVKDIPGIRWHNKDDEDANSLHYAACHNSIAMMLFLITEVNLNICARTKNGSTPYHSAVVCKSYQALGWLEKIRPLNVKCLFDYFSYNILDYALMDELPDEPQVPKANKDLLIDTIMGIFKRHNISLKQKIKLKAVQNAIRNGHFAELMHLNDHWGFQDTVFSNNMGIMDYAFQSLPDVLSVNLPYFVQAFNRPNVTTEPFISPYDKIRIWLLQEQWSLGIITITNVRQYIKIAVEKGRYHTLMKLLEFVPFLEGLDAFDTMLVRGDGFIIQNNHMPRRFIVCNEDNAKYPLHRLVMNKNNQFWRYSPHHNDFLKNTLSEFTTEYLDLCFDNEGFNILHRAILGGHIAAVKFLIQLGMSMYVKPKQKKDILSELLINAPKSRDMKSCSCKNPIFHNSYQNISLMGDTMYSAHLIESNTDFTINFDRTASFILTTFKETIYEFKICNERKTELSAVHIAAAKGLVGFLRAARKMYGISILECSNKHGITPLYLAKIFGNNETERFISRNLVSLKLPEQITDEIMVLNLIFSFSNPFPKNSSIWPCRAHKTILPLWRIQEKIIGCIKRIDQDIQNMILNAKKFKVISSVSNSNSKSENVINNSNTYFKSNPYREISPRDFLIILRAAVYRQYNYSMMYKIVKRRYPMLPAVRLQSYANLYISNQRYMYNNWLKDARRERETYNEIINTWFKLHVGYMANQDCPIIPTFFIDRVIKMNKYFFSPHSKNILSYYLKYDYLDVLKNKDTGIFSDSQEQRQTFCDIFRVRPVLSDFPLNNDAEKIVEVFGIE